MIRREKRSGYDDEMNQMPSALTFELMLC